MGSAGASQRRPRVISVVVLAAGIAAVATAWSWALTSRLPSPLDHSPTVSADAIARRVEAAFADASQDIARAAAGAAAARLEFFRGATSSACVTGTSGRGVFYCPETGTAALDLGYLEALVPRLKERGDLGLALVAGRLASEHFQRETGILDAAALDMIGVTRRRRAEIGAALALQADCLTGKWAASAGERLGQVPDRFWSDLVTSARNVAADFGEAGRPIPPGLDTFATASADARAAAFERGYSARQPDACPSPIQLTLR